MNLKRKKKGFTIVELVIVIAVIGVLAAILIPTFVGLVNKANVTSDNSLVRDLNNALAIDSATNGKHATMTDALAVTDEYGFNVSRINAKANKSEILWDSVNDVFCYFDGTEIKYIPEAPKKEDVNDYQYFVIRDVKNQSDISTQYSTYLRSCELTELTTGKGIDAGDVAVSKITYQNSENQNVVIRTNSASTTLVIDDSSAGTIKHYGSTGELNIVECHTNSYHEYGKVAFAEISKGRIVLEETSEVSHIHVNAKEGENTFDEVTIAKEATVEMPELSRDDVEIANAGTLVVALQNGTSVDSSKDFVWLTKQGVYEQITVSDSAEEAGNNWVNTSNKPEETKTAAQQIANNIGRNASGEISASVIVDSVEYTVTVDPTTRELVVTNTETGTVADAAVVAEAKESAVEPVADKVSVKAAVTKFAGGKGTKDNPFLIANADHWNNFYQMVYDWDGDNIPYFELTNDIDLTDRDINNFALNSEGEVEKGFFMWFDLNGNNHELKGITNLKGYCQVFPYIWDSNVHDITINYNLNETRTSAMVYYPVGDNYFTNVTTTGNISTTANWATAYVAYMYKAYNDYNCNVYYTNCVNEANIKGSYGTDGYIAVFGSHNGGGGHITFDNCKNYGGLLGGHVGFVGMGNDSAYTFVDENAVKNYGTSSATISVGYFNYSGDATTKTIKGVTCEVKQSSATKKLSTTHTTSLPENYGEKIVIDEVAGASKYELQMRLSVQVYNYDSGSNANKWSGGFPRSITLEYTDKDVVNGKIETELRKAYVGEVKANKYYGYGETSPEYNNGIFLPNGLTPYTTGVTIIENQQDLYLVDYNNQYFYIMYSEENHGWYSLLCTNTEGNVTTTSITISYTITAYNPNGSVLSFSNFSYTMPVSEAIEFFNGLA